MADEDDQLGTASLRRTVAAARATAGAGGRLPPAPPPDAVSTPWAQPALNSNGQPRREQPPPPMPEPVRPSARPRRDIEVSPAKKLRDAWMIAHTLLQRYSEEIGGSLSKAELHLAQGLMRNGTMLLRYGVPMESLSSLIRLARDLAHNTETDGQEDVRIAELRKNLERDEANLPIGEVINYESEGEENE